MKTFDEMVYNPTSEALVNILKDKTQNDNPLFFRVLVGFHMSIAAGMMRCTIATPDRGDIPVNMYAMNLSPTGTGKGMSTNIIENEVMHLFRARFTDETFPALAEQNLPKLSLKRANRKGTDPDDELLRTEKEFTSLGPIVFTFDSATPPAVKQLRHKLLMADAGSLNLQIDEIGSNLVGNMDVFNTFLELYDVGAIKQKLIKNTSDNARAEEIAGRTPTNMMLFGTPSKLLDGAKTEEELYSLLETGMARRCFFGYMRNLKKKVGMTPEQMFDQLTNHASDQFLEQLADKLERLADIINVGKRLLMKKDTSLILIEYRMKCEAEAMEMPEHEEIRKAELSHRYFKALKLAGAYAFIEGSPELTEDHLYQAIKLAEESGEAFNNLLTRDRTYVKLAKYLANIGRDVTQADLVEDLPFYRGATGQKSEMMTLAIAHGYQNNIIIKKRFEDGIEFFRGESLRQTDLNQMIVSYSEDVAYGYVNQRAPWHKLHQMTQVSGIHWCSHHLQSGHREEASCIPGFNLMVIDCDKGVNLDTVKLLLKDYRYLIYTTKRHQVDDHGDRFRIVLPMTYELKLDAKDFKEFMANVASWLPFPSDTQASQRARKWLSHNGQYFYNDGELFDPLPFIPKTSKNEERRVRLDSQQSMDNLERWVMNNTGDGNRNNMLLRYAMILVDAGKDMEAVRGHVLALNDKMPDKLEEMEIMSTIMVSVAKAIAKKE